MAEGAPITNTEGQEDKTLRGGDVRVTKIEVWDSHHAAPWDLTSIWKNISIFEDIETNYIRGEVSITDSKNVLMDAPILTGEKIIIEFKTPSHTEGYKLTAMITEIPTQILLKQGMQIYVIRFISPEFVRNQSAKFSKAYNEMLISDMVDDIYTNYIKDVGGKTMNIVPTTETISRVIHTMSPYKAINWLAKWAMCVPYVKGASCIFFENQHGFYFGPIEGLMDQNVHVKPAAVYSKINVHGQKDKEKDIKTNFYNITAMKIITPDLVKNIVSGLYSSKLLTHDLVLRQTSTNYFDYFDTYESMTHLTKNKKKDGMELTTIHNDQRLGKYSDSHIINAPKHYRWYGQNQTTNFIENTALERTSQLAQLGAIHLNITVPGDSNRCVGEIVELKLPAVGTVTLKDREGDEDKYLSGRYLIAALRHNINSAKEGERDVYNLEMNVVKDSFKTPLPTKTVVHWS